MTSPIGDAIGWIQTAALGTVATVIAIIAVAAIGILMLTGRFELRRGVLAILGCFILFGAREIGDVLGGVVGGDPGIGASSLSAPPTMPIYSPAAPARAYDPYAGASLPTVR
ncbi:MAG: hypothetical protein ABS87_01335 [Sphingomonas sp. SCN 67-18]|nr:MAG: hypothetical protein ABS87_01335 [Sphingomonas sp. SCN 67-18]